MLWFAVLKDFYDHLKNVHGRHNVHDALHSVMIRGELKSTIVAASELYTPKTWPRFYHSTTFDILNRIEDATSFYRDMGLESEEEDIVE